MEVSKLNRFFAIFIDYAIFSIPAAILGAMGLNTIDTIVSIVGLLYILLRDALLDQSVGHKVMGYKVVTEDGKSIKGDFLASFLRNILVVLIIDYFVMLFAKQRLGDNIAKTKVIKA
jgi:uncharacterized RDD family membrane protein YckC